MIEAQRQFHEGDEVTQNRWIFRFEMECHRSNDVQALGLQLNDIADRYSPDDAVISVQIGEKKGLILPSTPQKLRVNVYSILGYENAVVLKEAFRRVCKFYGIEDAKLKIQPKPPTKVIRTGFSWQT